MCLIYSVLSSYNKLYHAGVGGGGGGGVDRD